MAFYIPTPSRSRAIDSHSFPFPFQICNQFPFPWDSHKAFPIPSHSHSRTLHRCSIKYFWAREDSSLNMTLKLTISCVHFYSTVSRKIVVKNILYLSCNIMAYYHNKLTINYYYISLTPYPPMGIDSHGNNGHSHSHTSCFPFLPIPIPNFVTNSHSHWESHSHGHLYTVSVRNPSNLSHYGLTGREFDSRSGRHQVVTTWMGDCLRTDKPFRYITNHQGQLSLPSRVGKSSTGLLGWG